MGFTIVVMVVAVPDAGVVAALLRAQRFRRERGTVR
jgi:hypothetical protein